jgi:radical SAM/Cys-rich protein
MDAATFAETLAAHGLPPLRKAVPDTLQVNVGYLCNLACRHCHLEAGPARTERMSRAVMEEVLALARRAPFALADVTGGAPEMNPDIGHLLRELAPLTPRRIFRTNLVALEGREELLELLTSGGWDLGASLPAVNAGQVDGVRGGGVFERSLTMLRRLNTLGYGQGRGLELHLVSNPGGAFLPPSQAAAAKTFRKALDLQGIVFDSLMTFANVPLGRFRTWLVASGNLEDYEASLRQRFNPQVVCGLMCRSILSVGWDGRLYDCDFNQALGLASATAGHVRDYQSHSSPDGAAIPVGEHCFACTAGSGFT